MIYRLQKQRAMSELYALLGVTIAATLVCFPLAKGPARLKAITAIWLIALIITAPLLNTETADLSAKLVKDEGDAHYGLPESWQGEQVLCIHYPDNSTNADFADGRHFIDENGSDFMTDTTANATGACIGGLSGYLNGWELMLTATNLTGTSLEVAYSESEWGVMVTSIGGFDPSSRWDNSYWALYHNGGLAPVGIKDLVLEDDSVISWQVDFW